MQGGMQKTGCGALGDAELDGVVGGQTSLQSIGAAVVQAAVSAGGGLLSGVSPTEGKQVNRIVDKQMNGLGPG